MAEKAKKSQSNLAEDIRSIGDEKELPTNGTESSKRHLPREQKLPAYLKDYVDVLGRKKSESQTSHRSNLQSQTVGNKMIKMRDNFKISIIYEIPRQQQEKQVWLN